MNIENDIQVSVCVVTYNQENYIAECLESLVTQQTNFKFEIIVGEDCSKDSTRTIVQQYAEKYPDLIVPLFYEKNVGAVENVKQVYKKARGKYIAHIDGDDLALPNKLQKQYEILESSPDCIICSHDMISIDERSKIKNKKYWVYPEGKVDIIKLFEKLPFFAHSSKFFRKNLEDDWDEILKDSNTLDIEIHAQQLLKGNIYHLSMDLGGYREGVGVTANFNNKINPQIERRVIKLYEWAIINLDQHKSLLVESYSNYLLVLANNYAVIEGNELKFKMYTLKSLRLKFFSLKQLVMFFLVLIPVWGVRILKKRHSFNVY